MRHYKNKVTLDRKSAPRKALLKHLAESMVLFEKITTTKAKAKAVRSVVEKCVTVAKQNTLTARRRLVSDLYTKQAVSKLMDVLGPRYAERHGGYTRITMVKNRIGDGAEEVVLEFV